eukprot:gene13614-16095_t
MPASETVRLTSSITVRCLKFPGSSTWRVEVEGTADLSAEWPEWMRGSSVAQPVLAGVLQ